MIKRLILILFTFVFLTGGVLQAGTKADKAKPNVKNSKKPNQKMTSKYKGKMQLSVDYGFLPKQSKVNHTFWLKNIGLDTLEIITIKPG